MVILIFNLFPMKISALFFILCFSTVFAQTKETVLEVNAPVQSAIVYLFGAEVTHTKAVNLNAGLNKIVFTGLSTKLNSKSIQVNATGDISILAISDAINYMANQKESARVKELKDSLTLITDNMTQLNNDRDAYSLEKNMLLKNESIGGSDKGVTVAELKLAADLFRSRMKEINNAISGIDKQSNLLNEILIKLNGQLYELNAKNTQPSAEISILLNVKTKTTSTIDLKYIVSDAGWAPSYDLLATDVNQPIELKYRAKVFNNTGIDWNDVKIKLSTADPSQSASKPVLDKWSLDYINTSQNYYQSLNMRGARSDNNAPSSISGEGYMQNALFENSILQKAEDKSVVQPIQFEEIQVSELSAEFDIKINYSIPSDSKPYIVDVTEYKLPATYQHFSVPKLDKDAFLLARITGWEDLDLVEGPANVYYSGTYVGQSYVSTRSVDDTLDLSLGRDNKVLVTRSKIKEYCTKKFLGTTTKETFGYEMNIKNNRKTPILIEVNDQLPISTQGDIIVESIETSNAELDSKTGKLTWSYNLQPGEVKKIILSFSVKYPKNTNVNFQKTKMKARAKF